MITLAEEPGFDFGSGEYRVFFSRFGLTPFQHPDWLAPFYRRLPSTAGHLPLILVGRAADTGELRCVIPLLRDDRGVRPRIAFASLGVTDYAAPVLHPLASTGLALRPLLEDLVGEHDLDLGPIRHDHLPLWAQLCGPLPAVPLEYGTHAVPVSGPAAAWRKSTYGTRLRALRRKARRMSELGDVRLEIVEGSDAAAAMAQAATFRVGRFDGDPLQVKASAAFYAEVAASEGGLARTFLLRSGEGLAAIMFGLVHGRRFHYVVLACNYAGFARFSPGLMILDMAIEHWIGAGGDVFDFTIGDEPFKAAFGCTRTPMYTISTAGPPAGGSA